MKITFNDAQRESALRDVVEVYELAEERVVRSAVPCSLVQLRNAFQVFRYAFRDWALRRDRGVVLRALLVADKRAEEVVKNNKEMVIKCDDPELAEALENLLRIDGYTEESDETECS